MAESRSHAPGHEIGEAPENQHKMMASTGKVMPGGSFGVGPIPGTAAIKSKGYPNGTMLSEAERAAPGGMKLSSQHMHATVNPLHGPHGHDQKVHRGMVPKGKRPHHVG